MKTLIIVIAIVLLVFILIISSLIIKFFQMVFKQMKDINAKRIEMSKERERMKREFEDKSHNSR